MPSCFRYSLLDAHFTKSCDVIDYVTDRFAIGQFLVVVHFNRSFISCDFYRAMHFSANARSTLGIACRPSVRSSVRPSVCDVGDL